MAAERSASAACRAARDPQLWKTSALTARARSRMVALGAAGPAGHGDGKQTKRPLLPGALRLLVGVRGLEPRTSSLSGMLTLVLWSVIMLLTCARSSADVRSRLAVSLIVVTQLVTQFLGAHVVLVLVVSPDRS